jgi:hypothetical protein
LCDNGPAAKAVRQSTLIQRQRGRTDTLPKTCSEKVKHGNLRHDFAAECHVVLFSASEDTGPDS